jgi:hypothetical protein
MIRTTGTSVIRDGVGMGDYDEELLDSLAYLTVLPNWIGKGFWLKATMHLRSGSTESRTAGRG